MPCPPPQITRSAREQFVLATEADHRHGGTAPSGPLSRDTTTREPSGSTFPGVSEVQGELGQATGAGHRRRRSDDHHGAGSRGISSTTDVGSKCSGPTTTASCGQSGRGTSRAGSVAMSRRSGPGSTAGRPISTRTTERWRSPFTPGPGGQRAHHGIAQPAADTSPRSQPAAQRRQALRRPVERMGVELDPRYGQQFGGQPAAGGDHIRDHRSGASSAAPARSAPPCGRPAGESSRRRRCRR